MQVAEFVYEWFKVPKVVPINFSGVLGHLSALRQQYLVTANVSDLSCTVSFFIFFLPRGERTNKGVPKGPRVPKKVLKGLSF